MNQTPMQPLNTLTQLGVFLISLVVVAFGQPSGMPWLGAIASVAGYAAIFRIFLEIPSKSKRFWLGTLWFAAVHALQLLWMLYHPYNYIYLVFFGFSFLWGLQFGFFALFITKENLEGFGKSIALAALWTLLEWGRLFFLSGYSWNPAGLALTENLYAMQMASIGGIFLLSFWVFLVNILGLKAWLCLPKRKPIYLWASLAIFPYLFGYLHLHIHQSEIEKQAWHQEGKRFRALLVQTAFPAEETIPFADTSSYIDFVVKEWEQIIRIIQPHRGKKIDLIALPEYVVPFGTYTFLYPYEEVLNIFENSLGPLDAKLMPPLEEPFAKMYFTDIGYKWYVNNAFWSQAIANCFDCDVIAGLEDTDLLANGQREPYSAALYFIPNATAASYVPKRYAKRVLIPMAEYIPFSILHPLALQYGIGGSFKPGSEATVFDNQVAPFGVSICYEETFGDLMRECRRNGAELLVNLTSDVWYPNSNLPKQHFDHSRLRTVENGIPLLRACNTGLTSAIDSLGQIVATLGDTSPESQWMADALYVEVPCYHYKTLYSRYGDTPLIAFCWLALLLFVKRKS